jgi:hypothetical protein
VDTSTIEAKRNPKLEPNPATSTERCGAASCRSMASLSGEWVHFAHQIPLRTGLNVATPRRGVYSTFGFPLLSSAGVVALGLPPLSTVPAVA